MYLRSQEGWRRKLKSLFKHFRYREELAQTLCWLGSGRGVVDRSVASDTIHSQFEYNVIGIIIYYQLHLRDDNNEIEAGNVPIFFKKMLCLLNHTWVDPFWVQWEENSVSGGFIFLMWSFPRDFLLFIRTSTTTAAVAVVASHESIECEQQIRRRPLVQHGQQFWLKTSWRADAIKLYIFLVFGHSWQHSGRFRRQTTWGSNPVIISTTRFGDLFPFGRF